MNPVKVDQILNKLKRLGAEHPEGASKHLSDTERIELQNALYELMGSPRLSPVSEDGRRKGRLERVLIGSGARRGQLPTGGTSSLINTPIPLVSPSQPVFNPPVPPPPPTPPTGTPPTLPAARSPSPPPSGTRSEGGSSDPVSRLLGIGSPGGTHGPFQGRKLLASVLEGAAKQARQDPYERLLHYNDPLVKLKVAQRARRLFGKPLGALVRSAGELTGSGGVMDQFGGEAPNELQGASRLFSAAGGAIAALPSKAFGPGGAPYQLAAASVLKFAGALITGVGVVKKWNEGFHQANMRFAEHSPHMQAVKTRQEVRDILLDRERGQRRSEAAEDMAQAKHRLHKATAPLEDRMANLMNRALTGVTNLVAGVVEKAEESDLGRRAAAGTGGAIVGGRIGSKFGLVGAGIGAALGFAVGFAFGGSDDEAKKNKKGMDEKAEAAKKEIKLATNRAVAAEARARVEVGAPDLSLAERALLARKMAYDTYGRPGRFPDPWGERD